MRSTWSLLAFSLSTLAHIFHHSNGKPVINESYTRTMLNLQSCVLATLLSSASLVAADKDTHYFTNGKSNPNERYSHYYREGLNVVQDLADFDKLYVKFQNCAWSEYYERGEDHDGCGYDGGDEYWYMGNSMCYRANAAFTLYGVKAGASDDGCHKGTYINSFLTTTGVGALMSAIEEAGSYTFNTAYGDDGGDDNGDDDGEAVVVTASCSSDFGSDDDNNDDGHDHETKVHLSRMYQDATSYTVGCLGNDFSYNSFQGAYCDGSWTTGVVHKLASFNSEIKSVGCVAIYDAANGIDAATDLLSSYADACSIRQYPDRCPDPYGKLKKYTNRIESATGSLTTTLRNRFLVKYTMWSAYIIGIFLMIASCYVTGKAVQGSESKRHEMGISDSIVSLNVTEKNPVKLVGVGIVKTASLMKERLTSFAEATKDGINEEPTIELPTVEETPAEGGAPAETFKDETYKDASFTTGRKYKRPRLARLSKRLFRKKNKA